MTNLTWQRASSCSGGGNNCVEIASTGQDGIALRDSTRPARTAATSRAAFAALIRGVKAGGFTAPPA